ncbi:MAG TPA: alpha/beta fold hydrolase [Acidimicrobiales bacterium]|nr:alpha/beta fold hydrolase [Acidimicrobiales bacterium]
MPSRTFTHAGLTFDVDDSGVEEAQAEVVILLHGFPASRRCWDGVTPALVDAGYRVLAPDQRGYSPGARPAGRRQYAMEHLVGDVLALADSAGATRFHLVGHDWGGAVAWSLAASHPERLRTVTSLATPHDRALLRSMTSSTQALHSWYMAFYQLPWLPEVSVISDAGGKAFARVLVQSGLSRARAEDYVRFMRSGAAGPAINWYRAIPFTRPTTLGDVRVPAMYVYGTKDFALGRRAADLVSRYVHGPYRYEVLEGVSHWIPEEEPDTTARLLLEHFAAHAGEGDPGPERPPERGTGPGA